MTQAAVEALVARLWHELAGATPQPALTLDGEVGGLPSVFQVGTLASASVALATLAVAQLWAQRDERPARAVHVDPRHAVAAFRSERCLKAEGWTLPRVWDPLAGDYDTRDGWIRLHTNYAHHRDAALRVLGPCADAPDVARAVARFLGAELESAIVAQGGCAAFMHTREAFEASPQGQAVKREPLFGWASWPAGSVPSRGDAEKPLSGVRVLDLTRVIAGPVCTRFLAAYGADVLRLDPPGFQEVELLVREVTQGKRRAALDLRDPVARGVFSDLLARADVLVTGYRADALERLGFGEAVRRQLAPGLCVVSLNAYGFQGPWAERRGFDSLVQMSCGIAATGQAVMRSAKPWPLPAQALDHATGYLAAAAVCRALSERFAHGQAVEAKVSLARTAELLWELGTDGDPRAQELAPGELEPYMERADTPWGPLWRVRCPGQLQGLAPRWSIAPGPLGTDAPRFAT